MLLSPKQGHSLRCDSSWQQNSIAVLCSNPTSKVIIRLDKWWLPVPPSSDDNYAVSWSTQYTLDYLFILHVFIVTGGRVRTRAGGGEGWSDRGADRHSESRRGWAWNGVCRLCLRQILIVELANASPVYMSVHAPGSDCVSPAVSLVWSYHIAAIRAALWIYRAHFCDTVTFHFEISSLCCDSHWHFEVRSSFDSFHDTSTLMRLCRMFCRL